MQLYNSWPKGEGTQNSYYNHLDMAQRNEGRILDFLYEEARCAVIPIPI